MQETSMRILEIVTFTCFTTLASATVSPPPSNDNCATPVVLLATGVYPFDTTMATTSPGIALGICPVRGSDIWFSWTPTQVGIASFYTCNQTSLDTNIAVYGNGPCPVGPPLVCDDDACGNLESLVTWVTQAGVTYTLQLGRSGLSAGGTGTFTLDFQLPPANDDCGSPIDLGSTGGSSYDNTLGSTGVQGQGNPGCTDVHKDLWYRWTATQNGTATLDTCGQTGDDTALAVYAGSGCPAATALACDDDGCGSQSMLTWPITAGGVYTLQVGSSTFGNGGPGSFSIVETGSGFTGTPECFGDTAAACPCSAGGGSGIPNPGAPGNGCANFTFAAGANLSATGNAVDNAGDTLVLTCSNIPGPGLFFQSNGLAGPIVNFNDGTLCAAIGIIRMGVVFPTAGTASYPGGLTPAPIHVAGAPVLTPTPTKHYQCWYRDITPGFCNTQGHNMSNGVAVVWVP
jgi:hypothetical protein